MYDRGSVPILDLSPNGVGTNSSSTSICSFQAIEFEGRETTSSFEIPGQIQFLFLVESLVVYQGGSCKSYWRDFPEAKPSLKLARSASFLLFLSSIMEWLRA